MPRIAFINKMDREGADFYGTLEEIRKRLHCKPVPIILPVGRGRPTSAPVSRHHRPDRHADADFGSPEGAEIVAVEIPDEMRDDAQLWRGQISTSSPPATTS